jgi:hypothetical protein
MNHLEEKEMGTSVKWYKEMYTWFKRLPLIAFFFGPVEGIFFAIIEYAEICLFDPEWLSFIVWPLGGLLVGLINYVLTSIVISPTVLRTSVAIGDKD